MSSRVELVSALPRLQRKRPIPGSLHGRPKVRLREEEGSPEAQQGHTLSFESSLQLLLTPGRGRTNTVVLIFVYCISHYCISSARFETWTYLLEHRCCGDSFCRFHSFDCSLRLCVLVRACGFW